MMTSTDKDSTDRSPHAVSRLHCIDALRGLVMVLMAIDHSRDFFGDLRIPTEDVASSSLALFSTRWITHFCAPTFVFLAGISAWFVGERLDSRAKLSGFLLSRGVWLIVLEFTAVHFALSFGDPAVPRIFLVIAAIGTSMIFLGLLCYLPSWLVGIVGILIIATHNLLDGLRADSMGIWGPLWQLVHDGPAYLSGLNLEIGYPFLAWIGVIATGFGFAPLLRLPKEKRWWMLVLIGSLITLLFVVLRFSDLYGDPRPWRQQLADGLEKSVALKAVQRESEQEGESLTGVELQSAYYSRAGSIDPTLSLSDEEIESLKRPSTRHYVISFLACAKYPPSLCFLMMTLGPAIVLLGLFDRLAAENWFAQRLMVFGRVPLFFYLLHFVLLNAGATLTYWLVKGVPIRVFPAVYGQSPDSPLPSEFGFNGLWQVYVAWIVLLVVLYPLCWLYGLVKRRGKSVVWSYL